MKGRAAAAILACLLVLPPGAAQDTQHDVLAHDVDAAGDVDGPWSDRAEAESVDILEARVVRTGAQELRFEVELAGPVPTSAVTNERDDLNVTYLIVARLDGDPDAPLHQAHDTIVHCTLRFGGPRAECAIPQEPGLFYGGHRVEGTLLSVRALVQDATLGNVTVGAGANLEDPGTGAILAQDFTPNADPHGPPREDGHPAPGPDEEPDEERSMPGAPLAVAAGGLLGAAAWRRRRAHEEHRRCRQP